MPKIDDKPATRRTKEKPRHSVIAISALIPCSLSQSQSQRERRGGRAKTARPCSSLKQRKRLAIFGARFADRRAAQEGEHDKAGIFLRAGLSLDVGHRPEDQVR